MSMKNVDAQHAAAAYEVRQLWAGSVAMLLQVRLPNLTNQISGWDCRNANPMAAQRVVGCS